MPYYIGVMSGTSLNAVDAVLIDCDDNALSLIHTTSHPIPDHLKENILALCFPGENEIERMGECDVALGELFADCVNALLKEAGVTPDNITAVGNHGQTIRHCPNHNKPFTLQIGDPNIIASNTNITTVADFRRRDIAQNGQGAPLAPAFHNFLLRTTSENRWVLNIGGIANLTWLPKDPTHLVMGYDTGPGNTLMDTWCQQHWQIPYDIQGKYASQGVMNLSLLNLMLDDAYFHQPPPKSTGRELFNMTWLHEKLLDLDTPAPSAEDIQATLLELTACSITEALHYLPGGESIWVCGGGAYNSALMARLADHAAPMRVTTTAEMGIDPEWIEACAFAWLAKQTLDGKAGNIPSVTGANSNTQLGGVYFS